jgi:phage FluMu protein Com
MTKELRCLHCGTFMAQLVLHMHDIPVGPMLELQRVKCPRCNTINNLEVNAELKEPLTETVFATFYTEGTPYQDEAKALIESAQKVGVHVEALPFKPTGKWMANALARTCMFAKWARSKEGVNVCQLDSDVRFLQHPLELCEFGFDAGVVDSHPEYGDNWCPETARMSAGVVIFGPTHQGRSVLEHWAWLCLNDPKPKAVLREQNYLVEAFRNGKDRGVQVVTLDQAYNRNIDKYQDGDGTVILHTPASRKYRAAMGAASTDWPGR